MKTTLLILTGTLSLLSGCAVGPDAKQADLATPTAYSQPTPDLEIDVHHWSELYLDAQLTLLVEQARNHNHSLAALYQRTLQSRAIINRERAERRPQLNAETGYNRFKDSDEAGIPNQNDERYSAGVNLGWELDLFGRVSRLIEAAQADAEAADAAFDELLLITETDVAITYFRLRALDREADAVKRSVETRRVSLNIVNQRFASGVVSDLDVAQSETLLAESDADLAVLLRQRDAFEHALAVLTGSPAPDYSIQVAALKGTPVVAPVGVPEELLQRRPDLRQAENTLLAANARVGIATANFYPRITIGADAGHAALDVSDWFKSSAGFYSIGPKISLPIFQGGRLRAELSRREYAYAESLELYKQAVVEAFAEVEDALSGWRHLSIQRAARERAAQSAARAQSISNKQYHSGLIDFITALDSERVALDAERRLSQVIGDEYENSVHLIRSVGGTWK